MAILIVLFGYLLGSVPSAYIAGRLLRGIDLRQYGSGTVSGTGVYYHVAKWAVVAVGLFDIAKAAFPTWLGLRLGLGLPVALAAGLAAVVGHNWPLYLGFKGGRGISTFMGTLLFTFPQGSLFLLIALGIGRLFRYTALAALLALVTLPFVSRAAGQPSAVTWACLGMLLITVVKRLEANRIPLPPGAERRRVLVRRLLLDRDVGARGEWTTRQPGAQG
ncbi:MAG TPA: glycerol-3-phosphate acyltransferase [Anaerolineae bacterium]|nr:glycerol-3-phosphate acyltransferase [Anaerolineae bacterium]